MKLQTVKAKFPNNSTLYSYFIPGNDKPVVGDVILTSTAWESQEPRDDDTLNDLDTASTTHRLQLTVGELVTTGKLARIVSVGGTCPKATKFYMMLIPLEFLKQRRRENNELMVKARKIKAARERLEVLLAEQTVQERFANLAKSSPEAAELLKEFD